MSVNSFSKGGLKLFAGIALSLCAILFLAAFVTGNPEREEISKRTNIAVRAIGHDLLRRSGDFTTVVPPVIEIPNGVFQLKFENEFEFQPDTLVALAHRILGKTGLSRYTVTVQNCNRPEIVYGFEINPPDNSIISCRGRTQPKACYKIEVAFADFPAPANPYLPIGIMLGGIPLVLGFILISRNLKSGKQTPMALQNRHVENESKSLITLGRFVFDSTKGSLRMGEETILLTEKECKILMLLNRNIGQLTLREELIQDVWTDEGVITGRSLDMFISKLRKKLSGDPDLRITNIHGRGYRLWSSTGSD